MLRQLANLRLWQIAKWEADKVQLLLGCGKEEVGLVAPWIGGAVQLGPGRAVAALDSVTPDSSTALSSPSAAAGSPAPLKQTSQKLSLHHFPPFRSRAEYEDWRKHGKDTRYLIETYWLQDEPNAR
mgnify:CR=1 FL=1